MYEVVQLSAGAVLPQRNYRGLGTMRRHLVKSLTMHRISRRLGRVKTGRNRRTMAPACD